MTLLTTQNKYALSSDLIHFLTKEWLTLSFTSFLSQCRERVDQQLSHQLNGYSFHPRLQDAMRYSLFNGGKRVRPILIYASAKAIADITELSDKAALSIEAIHAYSLIHDDLPAMDNDDLRRGKPTCHIAFDEATAILAGDALQTLAFEALSSPNKVTTTDSQTQLLMLQTLATASGAKGMVAGQSMDLAAVNQALTLDHLETMHRLKTGALINASVHLGALSTGAASTSQLDALTRYADAIGLAFQVQDDILDVTANTETLGKQQGADAAMSKPTYVSLLGLDAAKLKAKSLHEQALDALSGFDYRADDLRHLSAYIVNREY
ncbi:MAG: geranylgeranyl diphosphate synthase type II [Kiritimatiellia bacterium]